MAIHYRCKQTEVSFSSDKVHPCPCRSIEAGQWEEGQQCGTFSWCTGGKKKWETHREDLVYVQPAFVPWFHKKVSAHFLTIKCHEVLLVSAIKLPSRTCSCTTISEDCSNQPVGTTRTQLLGVRRKFGLGIPRVVKLAVLEEDTQQ